MPTKIRETRIPGKLNAVDYNAGVLNHGEHLIEREKNERHRLTINVEDRPHPMTAHPNQIRGGKSLDVIVAGIWQSIWSW